MGLDENFSLGSKNRGRETEGSQGFHKETSLKCLAFCVTCNRHADLFIVGLDDGFRGQETVF